MEHKETYRDFASTTFYMKQLPPTMTYVVKETLNCSQAVAKECIQKYAVVAHDLAVA